MKVVSDPRMKALPFDLKDVEITDGPFRLALELDHKYLLELDCNRLLARFREYAGLKPKAPHYDGWEASTLSGHSLGHYLSACCMMYDATGDEALKHRIEYIVDELEACQSAHGDGYVSAIPRGRELFAEVASGNIRSKGFDLNDGWAPLYTLHKLMAGLRDAYRTIGSNKALAIETGLADWLKQVFINLSDEQMQDIMRCEFGGMNEVLADIYLDTSDEDALALAARFYHHDVLDPLAESKDCLKGKHANTQIPKLIGLLKQYQCTGDESLLKTAKFFWDRVVNHHSYVTGGNSNGEYFGSPDSLNDRLSLSTTETCNTYNMLKLSALLFQWDTSAEIADYCERALYNHILASIDPETGGVCYFLSLAMGGYKNFQDKFNHFTCCVGTGMENHASYGGQIYFHSADTLYINQFIPSRLNWREKGILLLQETSYPNDHKINFHILGDLSASFTFCIRYPNWAQRGIDVKINGVNQSIEVGPGHFVQFDRVWNPGDLIELSIPMSLRIETMPDNPSRVAVMHGPLVLAGDLGPVNDPAASHPLYVPVLISPSLQIDSWVEPVSGAPNNFRTVIGHPRNVTLVPLYQMVGGRYSVYWDVFSLSEWAMREPEYTSAIEQVRGLEQCTVDYVQLGEMQPERDHQFDGDMIYLASLNIRGCRYAVNGGWFSVVLKGDPEKPMFLVATYLAEPEPDCDFSVFINGMEAEFVATEPAESPSLRNVSYLVPEDTMKSDVMTVKFQAAAGKRTPKVYGLRTVIRNLYETL